MLCKAVAFVALSLPIVVVSSGSLAHPRSHGFWRFFAWETIIALFVLQVEYWFAAPFAWYQLVSWTLLILSCVPVIWGTILLRDRGRPAAKREQDPTLLAFEKTTELVTTGIYGYIRHPLYSSLVLLTWGIFFKQPSWPKAVLGVAATLFLCLTAFADEAECTRFFGPQYAAYMRRTKRFIPFLV